MGVLIVFEEFLHFSFMQNKDELMITTSIIIIEIPLMRKTVCYFSIANGVCIIALRLN
jgi:hypothetical protein